MATISTQPTTRTRGMTLPASVAQPVTTAVQAVTQPQNTNVATSVAPNTTYPSTTDGGFIPATIEPFNPIQERGFQMALDQPSANPYSSYISNAIQQLLPQVQGMYGQGAGLINEGADYARKAGGVTFDPSQAEPFMNKYVEEYINPTLDRIRREHAITQSNIGAEANRVGAFGDTGFGVQRSLNDESLGRRVAETSGQAYYNSYQSALDQAFRAAGLKAQNLFGAGNALTGAGSALFGGASGLGGSTLSSVSNLAGLGREDINQYRTKMQDITNTGSAVQAQNQRVLDAVEGSRSGAANYDWDQIQKLISILSAYKSGTGVTIPGMNTGQQVAGGAGVLSEILKQLGGGTDAVSKALDQIIPNMPDTF